MYYFGKVGQNRRQDDDRQRSLSSLCSVGPPPCSFGAKLLQSRRLRSTSASPAAASALPSPARSPLPAQQIPLVCGRNGAWRDTAAHSQRHQKQSMKMLAVACILPQVLPPSTACDLAAPQQQSKNGTLPHTGCKSPSGHEHNRHEHPLLRSSDNHACRKPPASCTAAAETKPAPAAAPLHHRLFAPLRHGDIRRSSTQYNNGQQSMRNQQLPTCCPSIVGVSLRTKPQAGIHRGNNSTQQVVRNECEIHRRMIPPSIVAATNIQCTDEAEQRNAHRGRTTTLNQPNKRYEQRMSESCSQQPLHSR